jgi:hypothetical protein
MAVSGKYGKVDIPNVGDEEPVFILRAKDKLSAPAIELYRTLAASHGSSLADTIGTEVQRFRGWKGSKKLPD